jgi:hypothetical protein
MMEKRAKSAARVRGRIQSMWGLSGALWERCKGRDGSWEVLVTGVLTEDTESAEVENSAEAG